MCDLEKNYYFSVDANKDDREFLRCILKYLSVLSQKNQTLKIAFAFKNNSK
jgi:hypothetical protein